MKKALKNVFTNWKTSLIGSGALAEAVINYQSNPEDIKGTLILAAIGLLGLFAKDGNKSHTQIK